jgi:hypothetical protein
MNEQNHTIKLYTNELGQPASAKLTYANGDVVVLNKINNSKYYDTSDKLYRTYPSFYKINNTLYA